MHLLFLLYYQNIIEALEAHEYGKAILEEYEKNERLGKSSRIKLVQIAVNQLIKETSTQ